MNTRPITILVPRTIFNHETMCGNTRNPYGCCDYLGVGKNLCLLFDVALSFGRCSNRFPNKCEDCLNAQKE